MSPLPLDDVQRDTLPRHLDSVGVAQRSAAVCRPRPRCVEAQFALASLTRARQRLARSSRRREVQPGRETPVRTALLTRRGGFEGFGVGEVVRNPNHASILKLVNQAEIQLDRDAAPFPVPDWCVRATTRSSPASIKRST